MEANTRTPQHDTWLIFRIGQVACAVPTLTTDTILPPPAHLTAAPGADAGRPGMFHHGSETVAVVDLRHRFGIETPDRSRGRLLLVHVSGRGYALWVDEVVALADAGQMAPAPLPQELPRNVFTQALLHRKEIVLCSDPARLLAMRDAGALRHLAQPPAPPVAAPEAATAKPAETAAPPRPAAAATPSATPPAPAPTRPPAEPVAPTVVPRPQPAPPRPTPAARPQAAKPAPQPEPPPAPPSYRTAAPPRHEPTPAAAAPTERPPLTTFAPDSPPLTAAPAAPEPPPGAARPLRVAAALLLVLLLGGGAWFGIDRWFPPPPQPTAPAPSAPSATPAAAPSAVAAPSAATLIASGHGVRVKRSGHEVTIDIDRTQAEAPTPRPAPTAEPAPPPARPAPPPAPKVYVHTVVKGDTLWAIAEHYLADPWRYKELAKLSHIRDPDLIYPGDRVRIVVH